MGGTWDLPKRLSSLGEDAAARDVAAVAEMKRILGRLADLASPIADLWRQRPRNGGQLLTQLNAKRIANNSRLPLLIAAASGIALSAASYHWSLSFERKAHIAHMIKEGAVPRALRLDRALDRQLEVVQSIGGLYAASSNVERHEFRAFAQSMLERNPNIQALEWAPRLAHRDRAAYEVNAHLDGFTSFRITEQNAEGGLVTAAQRDEYYPVYFVEPFRGNQSALGFDLGSNPQRMEALARARDS